MADLNNIDTIECLKNLVLDPYKRIHLYGAGYCAREFLENLGNSFYLKGCMANIKDVLV